jgi:hypothetical protein
MKIEFGWDFFNKNLMPIRLGKYALPEVSRFLLRKNLPTSEQFFLKCERDGNLVEKK